MSEFALVQVKERASIIQINTRKPVSVELSEGTRKPLEAWFDMLLMIGSEYLCPGRCHQRLNISTR